MPAAAIAAITGLQLPQVRRLIDAAQTLLLHLLLMAVEVAELFAPLAQLEGLGLQWSGQGCRGSASRKQRDETAGKATGG